MNVLGIHALSSCSGACLITGDGIHAVSTERLTRIPGDGRFPWEAIRYVMKASGLKNLRDIDLAVFDHFRGQIPARRTLAFLRAAGYPNEFACISHHRTHAAAAFLSSPFDTAAILVVDEMDASAARSGAPLDPSGNGDGMPITPFKAYSGYGLDMVPLRRPPREPILRFGEGRKASITKTHAARAGLVHRKVEDAVLQVSRQILAASGGKNLCHVGYLAGNPSINWRIASEAHCTGFFAHPATTDAAIPLGAALYGYHTIKRRKRRPLRTPVFLGRTYGRREVLDALRSAPHIRHAKPGNIFREVAAYLGEGNIVGWFEGASEIGPTSLGHRSVFADPRDVSIRSRLTREVKHGERFANYPLCILERDASDYFEAGIPSPFMEFSAKARNDKRRLLGAALRPDGTVRVQTVSSHGLPRLQKLLEACKRSAGLPILIQSSLCTVGEPIAESPQDAVNFFLNTGADFLVLEDYLCWKPHTRRSHAGL